MLLSEPGRTPYDINFSIFGFPVRVHPLFFLMPLLLGFSIIQVASEVGLNTGVAIVVLVVVFFLSILVHELGHTFAFRMFGIPSRIMLYWMGGLAIPGSNNVWSQSGVQRLRSNQQIIVSLAGPFFGFMLAGVLIGTVYLLGGHIRVDWGGMLPSFTPVFQGHAEFVTGTNQALWLFLLVGIWANVFWNILNLMPVFPLDGGQVARELFTQSDPGNGVRNSLYLSIGVAVAIAVFGFSRSDKFMGFFFAYMAFMSFQTLQMHQGGGFGGGFGGRRPW